MPHHELSALLFESGGQTAVIADAATTIAGQ